LGGHWEGTKGKQKKDHRHLYLAGGESNIKRKGGKHGHPMPGESHNTCRLKPLRAQISIYEGKELPKGKLMPLLFKNGGGNFKSKKEDRVTSLSMGVMPRRSQAPSGVGVESREMRGGRREGKKSQEDLRNLARAY